MTPQPGSFVFQIDHGIAPQGQRYQRVTRRRVLTVSADRLALSGAELLTEDGWTPCDGMMGLDLGLSMDSFRQRFTTRAPGGAAA